ncbi:1201_t:CDS:2 [Paraglomus brasilianum]|uniref:Glycogen [starch] synthase n=1 Tax=Paraglomus brasilianum TaxID=144538 RepID=A0A9N9FR92_9GLOM|nr:1201_t:CDS:2 [Paraglomus brasilianum]
MVVRDVYNETLFEVSWELSNRGIEFIHGKWLVEGAPNVILFDTKSVRSKLDEWKGDLWNIGQIPCPEMDEEMNDAILFGNLVAKFLDEFSTTSCSTAIISHFYDWQSSVAIPLIRGRHIDVTTIYNITSTVLGRYFFSEKSWQEDKQIGMRDEGRKIEKNKHGNGVMEISATENKDNTKGKKINYNNTHSNGNYNNFHFINPDEEAGKLGIYHRYAVERAAAHCADVFTCVSWVVAFEAENLIQRKPDGILPNGLDISHFSAIHEFQDLHARYKDRIRTFVRGHFYHYYSFDLDNTLYYFISGRHEFRNKGVDIFLEALSELNARLKACSSPITIVCFLMLPAPYHSLAVDALKGQAATKKLQEGVKEITERVAKRMFEKAARFNGDDISTVIDPSDLLTEEDKIILKRLANTVHRSGLPPVVTHNLVHASTDPILDHLHRLKLLNHYDDKVKIIFHPELLSSANLLFGIGYEEFVRGCNLGVFPSYYEPWGFKAEECIAMGVPVIVSNLSGFGCYAEETFGENANDYGVYIADRQSKSRTDAIKQITDFMLHLCQKTPRQRQSQRNRTERLSDMFDWKIVGMEYVRARKLALRRSYPDAFLGTVTESEDSEEELKGKGRRVLKPVVEPSSPRIRHGKIVDDQLELFKMEMDDIEDEET